MTGETVTAITSAIDALCGAIEHATPAEAVAGLDPVALIGLARDAELGSAWLGALQVLATSAARRCGPDFAAFETDLQKSDAVLACQKAPTFERKDYSLPEASHGKGGCT
jgi:hypothetical protein